MATISQTIKTTLTILLCSACAILFAFIYMQVMTMGWKMVLAFHATLVLAFVSTFFIKDMISFLIFILVASLSSGMDFHIMYDPVLDVQTGPFAEGIGVDLADFILVALGAAWLVAASLNKTNESLRFDWNISRIWLVWILWLLVVALVWAKYPNYAVYEVIFLFKGFILFIFIINFPLNKKTLSHMIYGLFLITVFHALFAIFQFVTRSYFTVAGSDPRYLAPEGFRAIGWLGSPDGTAILIVTVVPLMLGYYFNEKRLGFKGAVGLGLIICIAGILVTKVRIAGLSLMISFFVVFVLGLRRGWIGYGSTIKAITAALAVLILISPFILHRFEKGSWGEARIPLMITASKIIKKHWATGVGPSNYLFHIERNLPMKLRGTWEAIVHNEYMLRLAETGVIGFTLYYTLLLAVSVRLWRLIGRASDNWISFTAVGLLAAIVGSLAHRMTSIYHLSAIYTQFSLFFGMAGFLVFLEKKMEKEKSAQIQENG